MLDMSSCQALSIFCEGLPANGDMPAVMVLLA